MGLRIPLFVALADFYFFRWAVLAAASVAEINF